METTGDSLALLRPYMGGAEPTPSQWEDTHGGFPPLDMRRLMLALMQTAVDDVHMLRTSKPTTRRAYNVAGVWRWLESSDRTWPLSFLNCCEELGLDPGYIREGLATRTPSPRRSRERQYRTRQRIVGTA